MKEDRTKCKTVEDRKSRYFFVGHITRRARYYEMLWLFLYKKIEKGKESSWSQKIAYDFFIDVLVCVERNWDI